VQMMPVRLTGVVATTVTVMLAVATAANCEVDHC
jgi:hypothetical protein